MIRLGRPASAPTYLKGSEVQSLRQRVETFYSRPEQARRQERADFPLFPRRLFSLLMADLTEISQGKCAYCESPIKEGNASLDRFRPKAGAMDLEGAFSTEHYWWLAYQWENLYPACLKCNKFKGPKFPVKGD